MWKKFLLIGFATLIVLAVAFWFSVPFLAEYQLRKIISKADTASFSHLDLDIRNGDLTIHDIYLHDTSGNVGKQPILINLDRISLRGLKIWTLYKQKEIDLDSVVLGKGMFHLGKAKDEKKNEPEKAKKGEKKLSRIIVRHILIDSLAFRVDFKPNHSREHLSGVLHVLADSLTIPLLKEGKAAYEKLMLDISKVYVQPKGSLTYFGLESLHYSSDSGQAKISGLSIRQRIAKEKYAAHFGFDKDYLKMDVGKVVVTGLPKAIDGIAKEGLHLYHVDVADLNAYIYKDLTQPHSQTEKKFVVEMLSDLKIPIRIDTIDVKHAQLSYNENSRQDKVPGNLELKIGRAQWLNLNNRGATNNGNWTTIKGDLTFFDQLKVMADWRFDLRTKGKAFTLDLKIGQAPWATLNPFISNTVGAEFISGEIQGGTMQVEADKTSAAGKLELYHSKIKVKVYDKHTHERNFKQKVESELIQLVVGAEVYKAADPDEGIIYAEPVKDKSVFNYIAKMFFSGFIDLTVGSKNDDHVAVRGMKYLPMPKKAIKEADKLKKMEEKKKIKEEKKEAKKSRREVSKKDK